MACQVSPSYDRLFGRFDQRPPLNMILAKGEDV